MSKRGSRPLSREADVPFQPTTISARAKAAWGRMNGERVANGASAIRPLTLHECRHTFASLMIAAGVNVKALSTYMEHSSVVITLDRYGHLLPGNEDEAAGLLDGYLARALSA